MLVIVEEILAAVVANGHKLNNSRILSLDKYIVELNHYYNSLLNDKILDWAKFKAFADDKLTLAKMIIFLLGRIKYNMGN